MNLKRIAGLLCVLAAGLASAGPAWAVEYVALGDSYSSGTGTRSYYEPSCQRSAYAYPYLLHSAHPDWTFANATCAGARTGDLVNTQAGALTADTDWVTYTIGGNDAGFSSVITECALPSWASDCNGAIAAAESFVATVLPGRLDLVNGTIKARAPRAQVIALDYPRLFDGTDCNAPTFFSPSEMTRLNRAADLLAAQVRAAATRAGSNFAFRDVIPAFAGHAVCDGGSGSPAEWINGLSVPVGESYHPKATGHANGYLPAVRGVTG